MATVKYTLSLLSLVFLVGCMTATVHVRPVPAGEQIQHVCIEQNPKVLVADFLYVVEEGFERHGISTELVQADSIP
jgi:hypothetical protein